MINLDDVADVFVFEPGFIDLAEDRKATLRRVLEFTKAYSTLTPEQKNDRLAGLCFDCAYLNRQQLSFALAELKKPGLDIESLEIRIDTLRQGIIDMRQYGDWLTEQGQKKMAEKLQKRFYWRQERLQEKLEARKNG